MDYTTYMTGVSALGAVLNIFLLPLIAFKSGPSIGAYKYLLFFYVLTAIVYTTGYGTVAPLYEPSNKGWIIRETAFRTPHNVSVFCIGAVATCYIFLLVNISYSFIYRYCVLCAPWKLIWFEQPVRLAFLTVLYFVIVIGCVSPVVGTLLINKDVADRIGNITVNGESIPLASVAYLGGCVYNDNGTLNKHMIGLMLLWSFVGASCSIVSGICTVAIVKKFRKPMTSINSHFISLQRRLFVLLILQTIVPLLLTFLPTLTSYYFAVRAEAVPEMMNSLSPCLPLAYVIDPILIFCFIAEYRRFLFGLCGFCQEPSPLVSISNPTTN